MSRVNVIPGHTLENTRCLSTSRPLLVRTCRYQKPGFVVKVDAVGGTNTMAITSLGIMQVIKLKMKLYRVTIGDN